LGACSYAQSVISAHSGVVQYTEGDVSIDSQAIHPKFAEFPDVKPGQAIATEEGRVELLLTPGVFLRLAENSSVRMVSNSLSDTRLAVVSGSALVEVSELLPSNAITFEAAGTPIVLPHKGLYRIDADPARLRVYEGQARVGEDTAPVAVRKGHEVTLNGSALVAASFDTKDIDGFYRWSSRRSEYVTDANVASARVASDPRSSGYTGGVDSPSGRWSWNPYFGMFTYLPGSGMYTNPFGYAYYSPSMVQMLYVPSAPQGIAGLPASQASPALGASRPSGFGRSDGSASPLSSGGMTSTHGGGGAPPAVRGHR
jgi:hypothetical protein